MDFLGYILKRCGVIEKSGLLEKMYFIWLNASQ